MARTNAKSLASFAAKIDGMTRRDFIIAFGALPALAGERQVRLRSNPFVFGVASGDPAPCGDGRKPRCEDALAPSQTMMGPNQEKWLMSGLRSSRARWNVLA